ncbi:hypothetical protein ANO14919_025150 [Xylariales sp. No.14919]|nr:hypothetical protein ANO14919_025150 [Xylariales sp. No.14919]
MAEDNSITDNFALNWLPYFSPEGDVLPDILFAVECGICGNQLAISQPPDGDDIETFCVLPCGHAFGHECINSWLGSSNSPNCPSCRYSLYHSGCEHVIAPDLICLGDSYNMREAISSCIVGGDGLPSECENCRSDGASSSHWDGNNDEGGFDDQFQSSFPLESEFSRMNLGGGPSNAYGEVSYFPPTSSGTDPRMLYPGNAQYGDYSGLPPVPDLSGPSLAPDPIRSRHRRRRHGGGSGENYTPEQIREMATEMFDERPDSGFLLPEQREAAIDELTRRVTRRLSQR